MSVVLLVFLPQRRSYDRITDHGSDTSTGWVIEDTDRYLPLAEVWRTILNIRKWPHFLATASVFATWSPLTTYTPSVIMSLGFSKVEANGLAAVGSILTLPVVFLFAWLSDRAKKPGVTVIAAIAVYLVALILLRTVQPYASTWGKFGLWTAVNAFAVGYHPIHNAWIQVKCRTPEERSISLACIFPKSCWLTKACSGVED